MAEDDKRPAKYNITPLLTASGVAAMVAVLIVFFARSGLSVRFLALQLGVVGVCVYFLTRHLTSAPLATPKKAQRVRTSMRQSTRARWSSFFSAAFLTVPVTAVLTAGLVLLKPTFFENLNGLAQADPAAIGFFSIISIMASWSLSMVSRLGKLVSHDVGQSHYSFAVMGAVVGLAAYFAQQFLMVELPMGTYDVEGIFSQIGDSALFNVTGPTLLGYITFFTFLFGVRNWGQHLSSDRQTRFSVFAVLKALFVGWLATVFFSFPTTWALAWALMIGCVTQVVSPSRIEPHPWQHGRRV